MDQKSWKKYVAFMKTQDLPTNLQPIAEILGIESFMELLEYSGGTSLYFFKPDKLIVEARNRMILEDYPRLSFAEIARKHTLSATWVRDIINDGYSQKTERR